MRLNDSSCTGCGACENICPVNAIEMRQDKEGFLHPYINYDLCVNCGQCDAVCSKNPFKRGNKIRNCYAVWASDELRAQSSSGGMFSVLANYILHESGYVCGASFCNGSKVKHSIINDQQGLAGLRSSKYVQSRVGFIYREIKMLLQKTEKVILFSGTPCQVSGLYAYLGYIPPKLYTVDILCHGVPSQALFDRYLLEQYQGEEIEHVNFRDKYCGWTYKLMLKIKTLNHQYTSDIDEDPYYSAFNKRLSLRKSCGICEFSSAERQGDISLGDFWEIWAYDKTLDDRKGTSLVLLNSDKGEELFESVRSELNIVAETPIEAAIRGNPTLSRFVPLSPNRQQFFEDLNQYSLREAAKRNSEKEKPG